MARILVTDGDQRAALAIVRSLGSAGHEVYVCAPRRRTIAGVSRHARASRVVPDALGSPAAFVDAVVELVKGWDVELVLPVAEPALLALLPHYQRLEPGRIPFPDLATFRRVTDKELVLRKATAVGIAAPRQWVVNGLAEANDLPADLDFPLVLKPARSIGEADGKRVKVGVRYAADLPELLVRLGELGSAAFPVLLQRRVNGPGVGVFLLLWNGEVLAEFSHRRLREKPPAGGVSVYCESIMPDAELVAKSRALLESLGWWSVAMLEYKIEATTGTPYLMEINGRFWGSLQLAVDAGVDFPRLLVAAALGQRPQPVRHYRVGLRSRWWWGDIDHLLTRLRHSPQVLALPPGAPGRAQVLGDFLRLWKPGDRNEIFRLSDPAPALRESIDWFRCL